ncbi:hypothetical protein Brsp03_01244 [Brucella sp. NBRC 12951]|uniref:anti-sigma factor n=1 Tax=Brucella sp. NBRC 12951 TaxID=3075479 RepID=UPI0030AF6E57
MTSSEQNHGKRGQDDVLAGEYVLGVLSNEKRRQVEQRMLHDKEFALLVERWQISFSHFNDDYQELPVNENIFGEIEKRLFGSTQDAGHTVSLWSSVIFWRWVSLATTIAAGVAIIFAFGGNLTSKNSGPLVAELSATDVRVNLLASYDPASGYLQVIPVAAGASGEKSLELWLVLQKGNPVSLGIFKPGKEGELTIPLELRDDITAGTTLAVSLEPFGGSPTGVPSGPIVASGIVRPL